MIKLVVIFMVTFLSCIQTFGQVYTNMVVGEKNAPSVDSLKQKSYPYVLPIWGEKVSKMGFQLPYSAGISVNYFWQESAMIIDKLFVGLNNGPKYNLDEIVRFKDAVANANAINIRPDIWLFPFLNVYGIFAQAKTSTTIDAGLWIPDADNNWSEITSFSSKANFDATSFGFGLTPTIGVGGGWMALDMNVVWTDVSALDKPVFTFVFGPRLGKTFNFKKPDRNIAVWVGGFRVKFSSSTNGSINLAEVLPVDGLQGKVDQGFEKVENAQIQVDNWWEGLTPIEQQNPVNQAKYEAANRTLEKAGTLLTAVDGALSNSATSTVQYSLEKNPKDMWNFIIGSQFQLNKNWMVRAEYGFLNSRQQFMTGIQYRFGL